MAEQVDVRSIDTLAFVKGALAAFAHEAGQAISEMELQGQRGVDWVTVERAAHWKVELRRRSDAVSQAIKDLEHCRTYKKVGDHTPSCIEEKKALAKARRRLEVAEEKAALVRRWTPVVLQQFRETCVRLTRFREVIDLDCPRALAEIERLLRALDAYQNVSPVRDESAAAGDTGTASVTRQDVDAAGTAAKPAAGAAAPPAGSAAPPAGSAASPAGSAASPAGGTP